MQPEIFWYIGVATVFVASILGLSLLGMIIATIYQVERNHGQKVDKHG